MEFWLLAKVGVIVDGVVKAGYAIAGLYLARTGVKYYQDYARSVEQERLEEEVRVD